MITVISGRRSLSSRAGSTAAGHPKLAEGGRGWEWEGGSNAALLLGVSRAGPLPTAAGATPNDDPAFSSRNAAREATSMHNIHRVTSGIAVDPVRQIAIANPIAISFVSKLIPRG